MDKAGLIPRNYRMPMCEACYQDVTFEKLPERRVLSFQDGELVACIRCWQLIDFKAPDGRWGVEGMVIIEDVNAPFRLFQPAHDTAKEYVFQVGNVNLKGPDLQRMAGMWRRSQAAKEKPTAAEAEAKKELKGNVLRSVKALIESRTGTVPRVEVPGTGGPDLEQVRFEAETDLALAQSLKTVEENSSKILGGFRSAPKSNNPADLPRPTVAPTPKPSAQAPAKPYAPAPQPSAPAPAPQPSVVTPVPQPSAPIPQPSAPTPKPNTPSLFRPPTDNLFKPAPSAFTPNDNLPKPSSPQPTPAYDPNNDPLFGPSSPRATAPQKQDGPAPLSQPKAPTVPSGYSSLWFDTVKKK
ncbi:hypothetical protein F4818DRAFT_407201 [Hypoxylon cercidicola]|nr:hypothetical protein F4818DRAFT_407201 [Hypoxylon cercidicola]